MDPTDENRTDACFLYEAIGIAVACQPSRCSFWEAGRSGCALERVGLRGNLEEQPELVRWLLAVRSEVSAGKLELPGEPVPPYNLLPLPGLRS